MSIAYTTASGASNAAAMISDARARRGGARAEAETNELTEASDRVAVLERLGRLRADGLLTDEELAAEKQRLLEA